MRREDFLDDDNNKIINIMIEEREKMIMEKSKSFMNQIQDICIFGGINIMISILFFCGYYVDYLRKENHKVKKECLELHELSFTAGTSHLIFSFFHIVLPLIIYQSAKQGNSKYFNYSKSAYLTFLMIFSFVFVALIAYSIKYILQQEPCGKLRSIFIFYAALGSFLITGCLLFLLISSIKYFTNQQSTEETYPVNVIRKSIKYGSLENKE